MMARARRIASERECVNERERDKGGGAAKEKVNAKKKEGQRES